MQQTRCINCMKEIDLNVHICPHCGYDQQAEQMTNILRQNTILHGRYLVGRVIGKGGFGITYVGFDLMLEVKVAIKEYYPSGIASRNNSWSNQVVWESQSNALGQSRNYGSGQGQNYGVGQNQNYGDSQDTRTRRQESMERVLKEARRTAKLSDVPAIVSVHDVFQENETAYIVMEFIEGITLKEYLMQHGTMSWDECKTMLFPVMDALAQAHDLGIIHRDISPDNIMVRPNGTVKLLDLGAATDVNANEGHASTIVVKNHFSALEQYDENGKIGSHTDVYAFAAMLYYCLTGKLMTPVLDRMRNPEIVFPNGGNIPEQVKDALRRALAIYEDERTPDMRTFKRKLAQEGEGDQRAEEFHRQTREEAERQRKLDELMRQEEERKREKLRKQEEQARLEEERRQKEQRNQTKQEASQSEEEDEMKTVPWNPDENQDLHVRQETPDAETSENPRQRGELQNAQDQNQSETEKPAGGKLKKLLLLVAVLCVALVVGVVWGIVLQSSSDGSNVLKNDEEWHKGVSTIASVFGSDYDKSDITEITFLDSLSSKPLTGSWDVSEAGDGSVKAWVSDGSHLYIAAKGGVIAPADCQELFSDYSDVVSIDFNGVFFTENVKNMSAMFEYCYNLTDLDLSGFDTSQVTDMSKMFYGCYNLTDLDLSGFDTSQVTDMSKMFYGCYNLADLDLSGFDTSQVKDMNFMFKDCSSLTELDVSGFDTSQVTGMNATFFGCSSLTELDVSGFDTSQVKDMNFMFKDCSSLTKLDVSGFDTSQGPTVMSMFANCSSLTELDVSGFSGVFYELSFAENCSSLTSLNLWPDVSDSDREKIYERTGSSALAG